MTEEHRARWKLGPIEIRSNNTKGLLIGVAMYAFAIYGFISLVVVLLEKL